VGATTAVDAVSGMSFEAIWAMVSVIGQVVFEFGGDFLPILSEEVIYFAGPCLKDFGVVRVECAGFDSADFDSNLCNCHLFLLCGLHFPDFDDVAVS